MSAARTSVLLTALRRQVAAGAANPRYLILALGMPPAVYLLYTAGDAGMPGRLIAGASWPAYFMVSMAALAAIGAAVSVAAVPRPARSRARERLAIRLAAAMVLVLPAIGVVGLAAVVVHGVRLPVGGWFELLLALWLGALPFVALGLVLGSIADRDIAGITAPAVIILLALLGGLFQPVQAMPAVTAAIAHVVPSFHLAALGWTAIAGRGPDPADVAVLAGYALLLGAMLRWRGGDETTRADG
jgi:ABC-2 type transport system permease protein